MKGRYDGGDLKIYISGINDVFRGHAGCNFPKPQPKLNSKYFNTQYLRKIESKIFTGYPKPILHSVTRIIKYVSFRATCVFFKRSIACRQNRMEVSCIEGSSSNTTTRIDVHCTHKFDLNIFPSLCHKHRLYPTDYCNENSF